jgi:hypothetical protein
MNGVRTEEAVVEAEKLFCEVPCHGKFVFGDLLLTDYSKLPRFHGYSLRVALSCTHLRPSPYLVLLPALLAICSFSHNLIFLPSRTPVITCSSRSLAGLSRSHLQVTSLQPFILLLVHFHLPR